MSNVLFFPYYIYSPHLETDVELMQTELDKKNNIFILCCNGCLTHCDMLVDAANSRIMCYRCRKRILLIKRVLAQDRITYINLGDFLNDSFSFNVDSVNFRNRTDVTSFKYDNFDLGYGLASSFANKIEYDGVERWSCDIKKLLFNALNLYTALLKIIDTYHIEHAYIFNGRLCFAKTFIAAMEKKCVTWYIHERGCNFSKYIIFKKTARHSIKGYKEQVLDLWNTSEISENDKVRIASEYYKKRRAGCDLNWISFTKQQKNGKIPDSFSNYKFHIVIYNSSGFEYNYISSEYGFKMYESQLDGIKRICESFKDNSEYAIYIREHPNLKNTNWPERTELRTLQYKNCFIIPAESDIDSYELLFNADYVVTFNSTMGIEATFWGKPSILCSNAIYELLNVAYYPTSHQEVINLLKQKSLKPINRSDSIKIGFYEATFGTPFKYYKPTNLFSGKYRGFNFNNKNLKDFLVVCEEKLKSTLKR